MNDDQGGRGPSWFDVQKQLEWLEREYLVSVTFYMHPNWEKGFGYRGLLLVVKGSFNAVQKDHTQAVTVSAIWPKSGHKTMPAAIMALAHALSEKLYARAEGLDLTQQSIG